MYWVIQILQLVFILFLGFVGVSWAWWITMDPHHKEVLGGTQDKALKTILNYGIFGNLPEEKDKPTGK